MNDDILKDIEEFFEITDDTTYEFRKLCGFKFVFRTQIVMFKDRVSSAEIAPVGVIWEENDEYYFAPLGKAAEIDEIVREYVEKILI